MPIPTRTICGLVAFEGMEPSCPRCGNANAMLHDWEALAKAGLTMQDGDAFKCRDCGHVHIYYNPTQDVGQALRIILTDHNDTLKDIWEMEWTFTSRGHLSKSISSQIAHVLEEEVMEGDRVTIALVARR